MHLVACPFPSASTDVLKRTPLPAAVREVHTGPRHACTEVGPAGAYLLPAEGGTSHRLLPGLQSAAGHHSSLDATGAVLVAFFMKENALAVQVREDRSKQGRGKAENPDGTIVVGDVNR